MTWILYTALVFYNWVDYHNTIILLRLGGTELNPLLVYLIDATGTDHVIALVKLAILIPAGLLIAHKQKENR